MLPHSSDGMNYGPVILSNWNQRILRGFPLRLSTFLAIRLLFEFFCQQFFLLRLLFLFGQRAYAPFCQTTQHDLPNPPVLRPRPKSCNHPYARRESLFAPLFYLLALEISGLLRLNVFPSLPRDTLRHQCQAWVRLDW